MEILKAIYIIVAVVLLFGAAIFVHELGHFIAARLCSMKVEALALGFGPCLFRWKRNGIEYSIRVIPAGGFVRIPQMAPSPVLEGTGDSQEKLEPASPWSKMVVSVAGPAMNVVFAFFVGAIVWLTGLPVVVAPPIIGYVAPDSDEAKLGIQLGDKIVMVDGRKVQSWQDVMEATALARTNIVPVVIERNGVQTTYYLKAVQHEWLGLKMLRVAPRDRPMIVQVRQGSPAEAAGLKAGDKVIEFAGVPIYGFEQLVKLIEQWPEQPAEIKVERDKEKLTLIVTPVKDPRTGKKRIGVTLGTDDTMVYVLKRPGPTPWAQVWESFEMSINVLGALLHSKSTGVGASDLSGPVGIITMLVGWVKTDYRLALRFLVLVCTNLAFINLFPIPVLDGGYIAFALIEKVRGKPLNAKLLEYTTTAFGVALLLLLLYVTFFDIKRLPVFTSFLKTKVRVEQAEPAPPQ